MDTLSLVVALPKCKQIVTKYIYKERKIHDVILTDKSNVFALPFVAPAVQVDIHGKGDIHVPSDHDKTVAIPLSGAGVGAVTREYGTSRHMSDSAVRKFGLWITGEDWTELKCVAFTSQQGQVLKKMLQDKTEQIFPQKQVRVSNTDKP